MATKATSPPTFAPSVPILDRQHPAPSRPAPPPSADRRHTAHPHPTPCAQKAVGSRPAPTQYLYSPSPTRVVPFGYLAVLGSLPLGAWTIFAPSLAFALPQK